MAGSSRPRPEPTTIDTSWIVVGRGLAAEEVLDDRLTLLGRDVLVGEGVAQLVARLEERAKRNSSSSTSSSVPSARATSKSALA